MTWSTTRLLLRTLVALAAALQPLISFAASAPARTPSPPTDDG
jgi:hypothetical protein